MKTRHPILPAMLIAAMSITSSFGQDNNRGMITTSDYFGDPKLIWDTDGDGWDDLWVGLNYRGIKPPFSAALDSDSDGVTDYHEMILWRDPWTADPLPVKLTPQQQQLAQAEAEKQAKIQLEENKKQWAKRKQELEATKGIAPVDEAEDQRKREEERDKQFKKLNELPKIQWTPSSDSLSQIIHSQATVIQDGAGQGNFTTYGITQTIALGEQFPPFGLHPDFEGRVSVTGFASSAPRQIHASMTAGAIASSGAGSPGGHGRGIASKASVVVSPLLMNESKQANWTLMAGKDISAHPYSIQFWSGPVNWPLGVPSDQFYYQFQGRPDVSRAEPNFCGMYTSDSGFIDAAVTGSPNHLYVQSASNVRGDGVTGHGDFPRRPDNPTDHAGWFIALDHNNQPYLDQSLDWPWYAGKVDNGKDSLPPMCVAKNALVVGGIRSDNTPTPMSGWGPTDDGRIKPDMVAVSYDVTTTVTEPNYDTEDANDLRHHYDNGTGNSYSVPAVAAGAALIADTRSQRQMKKLKGASVKALLMATATDVGLPGPDPQTGFGAMNVTKAVKVVLADTKSSHIKEVEVRNGQPVKFDVKVAQNSGLFPASMRLKVFICWDDPSFTPNAATLGTIDQSVKTLVNDLDLVVTKPGDLDPYEPVALTTGSSKTFAVNNKDNVEQVEVYEAGETGIFTIEVRAANTLTGPQPVSIVLQGIDPTYTPPPGGGQQQEGGNPSAPTIERTGVSEFNVTWPSIAGRFYALESSPDLVTWSPVVDEVSANGYYTSYPVPALGDRGFYRVIDLDDPNVVLPPVASEP